jgi:hypothetical protein
MTTRIACLFLCLLIGVSCRSIGGSDTDASDYLLTFAITPGLQQYFIKPISATSLVNDDELFLDCTMRHGAGAPDTSVLNFSVVSSDLLKNIDSFAIATASVRARNTSWQLLFNERSGDNILSRFSVGVRTSELLALTADPRWTITVTSAGKNYQFVLSTAGQKALSAVDHAVFSLLR